MSTVLEKSYLPGFARDRWMEWIPVALGLLVMFVPSFLDLSKAYWKTEIGGHGPIILMIVLWLFWRDRAALIATDDAPSATTGWVLVGIGLLLYILGRSQALGQLEAGALMPLLAGLLLALRGGKAFKALWFPIFFVVFLVPIPGSMLDAILFPLKKQVSFIVEYLLYNAGYPVARTGVVLTIGQYQLLIADACSGLNSMIALSGVGLLFVFLMQSRSVPYNLLMLVSIIPIAFVANICRVLLLMLVTYYQGDRFGQEFHDYAGYLEILFAFGGFFAFDAFLRLFVDKRVTAPSAPAI